MISMNTQDKNKLAEQLIGTLYSSQYIEPIKEYDVDFKTYAEYKQTLPDLQNDIYGGIREHIEHVGIHGFRLPLKWDRKDNTPIELETIVTGTVSLDAESRGINMSRIVRSFYEYKEEHFNINLVEKVLQDYRNKIGSFDAKIALHISYPILQESLRTGLSGYQYYDVTFEISVNRNNEIKKVIHFDFVYSSACPCSNELSEHARKYRNRAAIPHSQRSTARVSVMCNNLIWLEDLQQLCLSALKTETQVMVLREDEQAFAELNGANPKFVEDAARLLYKALNTNDKILDFKVVLSHLESLHSHDAIAVIIKGVKDGFNADVSFETYRSLKR